MGFLASLFLILFRLFSNMDEGLKDWNRLSLTEDEGARVNLDDNQEEVNKEYILTTRFLARRVLNV